MMRIRARVVLVSPWWALFIVGAVAQGRMGRVWRVVRADLVVGGAGGLRAAGGAGAGMGAQHVSDATAWWVFSEWGGGGYGFRYWRGRAGISQLFVLPGVGEGRV